MKAKIVIDNIINTYIIDAFYTIDRYIYKLNTIIEKCYSK